jgi:hypothetical protein
MKKIASLLLLAVFLTGCASPANYQAMTVAPRGEAPNPAYKEKLAVRNVYGGQGTNPLWTSQVSNEAFKSALQDSLDAAGYGARKGNPTYYIDANLQKLDQPFIGLSFTVHSTVTYHLTGGDKDREYPISAEGTATASDQFLGVERLRIANERAIQNNIEAFLKDLRRK